MFGQGRVYLFDGVGVCFAMAVYLCDETCLCLARAVYVYVMELAYVWQRPCIFVRWSMLIFGNGCIYLYDGVNICLAMVVHVCAMEWLMFGHSSVYLRRWKWHCFEIPIYICAMGLAYVWQRPHIYVLLKYLIYSSK